MTDVVDRQIDAFLDKVPAEEHAVLREYVALPNEPDTQIRIASMRMQFGSILDSVSDKVEALRQATGLHFDELRERLNKKLLN